MCKYCDGGENGSPSKNLFECNVNFGVLDDSVICGTVFHKQMAISFMGHHYPIAQEINYCPMCGRKLGRG